MAKHSTVQIGLHRDPMLAVPHCCLTSRGAARAPSWLWRRKRRVGLNSDLACAYERC